MKYIVNSIKKDRIIMRLLWIILYLFCSLITLLAQNGYTVQTVPNVRLTNSHHHVTDPDTILSSSYVDSINYVLNVLEDSSGIETAVVALKSIEDAEPRQFATELFNYWKLGKENKDNGLLILLVANPQRRTVTFETGYGLEGDLPDAICKQIQLEFMIPDMKDGNYGAGMLKGVQIVAKYLHGDLVMETEEDIIDREASVEEPGFWTGFWVDILLGAVLLILVILVLFHKLIFEIIIYFFIWVWKKIVPRKCPECGKRTLKFQKNEVKRKATFKAKGYGYEVYVCKNCGHTIEEKYSLDKLEPINLGKNSKKRRNRSSSSSHSSRGGSWGGGSSGGGGASSDF